MVAQHQSSNGGRVAKNTTYLTMALLGQKVLSSLYFFVIFRLVGPSNTGEYLSALSFVAVFAVLIDLGLTPAFIRQTARNREDGERDFRDIISFKLVSGIVASLLVGVAVIVLSRAGKSHPDVSYLIWAVASMFIDSLTSTMYGFFRGLQMLEYESAGTVIHRVSVMIIGITGAVLKAPPIIIIIAVVGGSIANFSYAAIQVWRQRIRWQLTWKWIRLKKLLLISLPFGIAALFTAIYSSSDTVLLRIFTSQREVGIYGFALKGILMFQIIPAALVAAIYPAMSAAFINDRARLQQLFTQAMTYLMIVVIPISVVVFILAQPIVLLYGGSRVWFDAILPLRILVLGLPFLFLNFPVGYLLNAANRQTVNTINTAIVVVLNITANVLLIEKFSYRIVAINSLAASVLLLCLGLWFVRRVIDVPVKALSSTLLRSLVAGAVLGLVGWQLMHFTHRLIGIAWVTAVLVLIYAILLFALRLLKISDIQYLFQRLRRT